MRRLRIGPRLTLFYVTIVLLTFMGSAVGVWEFIQVREQAIELHQVNAEAIALLRVNNKILSLENRLQELADTQDPARFAERATVLRNNILTDVEHARAVLSNAANRSQEPRYSAQFTQLANIAGLASQIEVMIRLAEEGNWLAVQALIESQAQAANQISQNLVIESGQDVVVARRLALQNMDRAERQALATILMTGLLILLIASGLGYGVIRSIALPLARLDAAAKALARREFHHRLAVTGDDELTSLSHVLNNAASQLAEFYSSLEQLVQKRTQELRQSSEELQRRYLQLETSIALGNRITSILDLDTLLDQVVELIRERYGFYYVGIFLLNESGDYVIARAGTGQIGHALRQQGFRLRVGQEGIIGWVAQHGRLARVDNVAEDSRYLYLDITPDTRSELALPLAMGGTMLGVLDIQSDQVQAFRLDDMPVWQALADQVAIAIQNALLYQGERSRRHLAETLYDVGRAISQTLDLNEVLDLILEHLAEIVPYDRAAVMLQKGDELEIVAARGFPANVQPSELRIAIKTDDVFQEIYHSQQPLLIPDVLERSDWQQVKGLPLARAWLGVPLNRFGKVIGMLSLTREVPNAYNDDQAKLAITFASQAAIALENARLYNKITVFTQQLEDMVRERTEAVQEAYIQLEHLDRTKSDFIKIAAHELRTPLTVLQGYSKMLLVDPLVQENNYHLQLVAGIHSGAIRLHEIVDSMLDITKIDNRALELYPEPLDVASLIQLVGQKFSEALAERNQTLVIEDMSHLPALDADPDALPKVFHHLIINAIKYTPDGGVITISGRAVAKGPKDYPVQGIEIVVSDTGIGIDPQFHELIFTKFYQTGELALHSSSKTKFKGAGPGLGLAIARGIVEAHRGKIWVESPGQDQEKCPGSRFYLFLPLRQKKPKRRVANPAKTPEYAL